MDSGWNKNDEIQEVEIDLVSLVSVYKRNWKKIILASGITTFASILYSYTIIPTYLGNFQVVVEEEASVDNTSKILEILPDFGFSSPRANNLKTQEFILKSPSVLMPVFNYVIENTDNQYEADDIKKWISDDLDIEFTDGTNILQINYKNKNKEFILEVLNMISSNYQKYANFNREKAITRTIDYLSKQQKIYKEKAKKSRKELNLFSINNGLGDALENGFINLEESSNSQSGFSKKQINFQNSPSSINKNQQISSTGTRYKKQFSLLEKYEANYLDLSSKLKPDSEILKSLKIKIENLKSSLKRPNEILLKFGELKKIAIRDEKVLSNLEDQLVMIQLEKVKQLEPWEMISKPIVNKNKISPKRDYIAIVSLLISFFVSYFIFLIKEKKSGKYFELNDLKLNINCKLLDTIYTNNDDLSLRIIKSIINDNKNLKIGYVKIDEINVTDNSINNITSNISKTINYINLFNEEEINKVDKILLLVEKGKCKRNQIFLINKYISIYKNKFLGWVYVSDFQNI